MIFDDILRSQVILYLRLLQLGHEGLKTLADLGELLRALIVGVIAPQGRSRLQHQDVILLFTLAKCERETAIIVVQQLIVLPPR